MTWCAKGEGLNTHTHTQTFNNMATLDSSSCRLPLCLFTLWHPEDHGISATHTSHDHLMCKRVRCVCVLQSVTRRFFCLHCWSVRSLCADAETSVSLNSDFLLFCVSVRSQKDGSCHAETLLHSLHLKQENFLQPLKLNAYHFKEYLHTWIFDRCILITITHINKFLSPCWMDEFNVWLSKKRWFLNLTPNSWCYNPNVIDDLWLFLLLNVNFFNCFNFGEPFSGTWLLFKIFLESYWVFLHHYKLFNHNLWMMRHSDWTTGCRQLLQYVCIYGGAVMLLTHLMTGEKTQTLCW